MTQTIDSTRRSNVYYTGGSSIHGKAYSDTGTGENITGKRTFSAWLHGGGSNASTFAIHIETDYARRAIFFDSTTGSPYYAGPTGDEEYHIRLGSAMGFKAAWRRLERDLSVLTMDAWGENLVRVTGVQIIGTSSYHMSLDDLAFSNSLTVEHDTLGPGSIGHILRHRTINTSTYAATDAWYHYDQVGSVMDESNSSGALSVQDWQDAYGDSQVSFTTGLIGGTQSGFHHNTKEYDGDVGLVYMYQRWYCPETGTFLSKAPMGTEEEHPFSFAAGVPTDFVDPSGEDGNWGDFCRGGVLSILTFLTSPDPSHMRSPEGEPDPICGEKPPMARDRGADIRNPGPWKDKCVQPKMPTYTGPPARLPTVVPSRPVGGRTPAKPTGRAPVRSIPPARLNTTLPASPRGVRGGGGGGYAPHGRGGSPDLDADRMFPYN